MSRLAALPIPWKLTLVSTLASATVLLIACAAFTAQGVWRARQDLVDVLRTRTRILGVTSAAPLLFEDPKAATETLHALRVDPHAISAVLYGPDRSVFARYSRQDAGVAPPRELAADEIGRHRFEGDRVRVVEPVQFKRRQIGFIALEADLGGMRAFARGLLATGGVVLVLCVAIGYVLGRRLQRVVSRPILDLADAARSISHDRNYDVRVPVGGADEIGVLATSFNGMLAQVEQRDGELEKARAELEQRVEERTRELADEVAERRQAQEALARQTEELSRSNAELEQFAYVASHDLQEPLRMVASYTQLLAETHRGRLGPDADDYIQYAVDGASRMQKLITDLLTYSRVGRGNAPLRSVVSAEAVEHVLANLRVAIAESGARVVVTPLPSVRADPSLLVHLFQNLIGNGIKFRGDRPPEIRVEAARRDGMVVFAVRDNGIGFDQKYADKIFVIFQRLHSRDQYSGTGIGLAVCKKIVERLGGRIWVESAPGRGSCFYFSLQEAPGVPRDSQEEVCA